jgi:regulator of protease activity HflC (stomatin/prohibitin superfamily)
MKRMLLLCLGLLMLATTGCDVKTVNPGYVGIKVYLLGSSKGVDMEEKGVGRYFLGVNEDMYLFPTFQQNYKWTRSPHEGSAQDESFTFQTQEGLAVNADVGITYSLDPAKVPLVFQTYRRGIDEITDTFLRNYVRDALNEVASHMSVTDVYGPGKVKLMLDAQALVQARVQAVGIKIDQLSLISNMRLPETVVAALNSKIEATQRAQQRENELREAEAQAAKEVAKADGEAKSQEALAQGKAQATLVEADAQARANITLAKSLTPELIEYRKIDRWNGQLPQFGGNVTPLITIPATK